MWIVLILLVLPALSLCCLLLALRVYLTRAAPCPSSNRLTGRTVIVTGAGSGIGLVTARECSRRGATVVVACPNKLRAERIAKEIRSETLNDSVIGMQLDLASLSSVEQFYKACVAHFGYVDVLVNNAAYMGPAEITQDGFDKSLQINYLSHCCLTSLFINHYRITNQQKHFRVVNVATSTHSVADAVRVLRQQISKQLNKLAGSNSAPGNHKLECDRQNSKEKSDEVIKQRSNANINPSLIDTWTLVTANQQSGSNWWELESLDGYEAYAITKFFLQLFSFELHRNFCPEAGSEVHSRTTVRNLAVLSVNPGPTRTGLQRHLRGAMGKFVRLLALLLFRSPEAGAQSVVHCVVMNDEEAAALSGTFLTDCAVDRSLTDRFEEIRDYGPCVWPRANRLFQRLVKNS